MMEHRNRPATTGSDTGQHAVSPFAVPPLGWKAVLVRTWKETGDDNVGLLAAGVAFYGFLAMVPLLGAIVLSYGLVADPATVVENVRALTSVMPAEAAKLIGEQLLNVVTTSGGKKGFGLLLALGLALYGAMKGAGAVITALNVAYEEKETRGFVRLNLVTLAITIGAVLIAIVAMIAVATLGHLDTLLPGAPGFVLVLGKLASYVMLGGVGAAAAATLYRYAPDRDVARWIWLTPGSLAVTILWLALTLGFGTYVANFGSYDATYGSLGAVVVLLTWLYLSAYILIMGAELNAELEHQTAADTTAGPAQPLGTRGAEAADTVAGRLDVPPRRSVMVDPHVAQNADRPGSGRELIVGRATGRAAVIAGIAARRFGTGDPRHRRLGLFASSGSRRRWDGDAGERGPARLAAARSRLDRPRLKRILIAESGASSTCLTHVHVNRRRQALRRDCLLSTHSGEIILLDRRGRGNMVG